MVGDFIICLPAFFNIYIYLFIISFFIFKKRGVQKGIQKGIQKGVQKGGPEGRVHVLSTPVISINDQIMGGPPITSSFGFLSSSPSLTVSTLFLYHLFYESVLVQLKLSW